MQLESPKVFEIGFGRHPMRVFTDDPVEYSRGGDVVICMETALDVRKLVSLRTQQEALHYRKQAIAGATIRNTKGEQC